MNDYKKLNNQPLKLVLAEFCFSPIRKIAEYVPAIQEALRRQYPIDRKGEEQVARVQPGGISMDTLERWTFISANRQSAIGISQERLVYVTAEYQRFDGFSDACKQAIGILADIVGPSLILRIGLRYSDLVLVEEEKVSDLVDEHFGYPGRFASLGEAQHTRNETFLRTDIGGLVIRTMYGQHDLTFLPDIKDLPISINLETTLSERIILDFDHFWEAREEPVSFEVDELLNKLGRLHKTSRKAFWEITTDYARNERWA